MEVLTVHGNELRQGIPLLLTLYRAPNIATVGTIFHAFSYDALLSLESSLSPPQRLTDALRVEFPNIHMCKGS